MKTNTTIACIALQTLLRKEIMRFMRIWSQTLLPPAITMSLYFLIFGKFIGAQIEAIEGFSYIKYIVPGLVMMAIMTNSYANTSSSFFINKFNKSVEEMLASPMPHFVLLLGFILSGALRGVLVGIIVFCISYFFTHVPIHYPLIAFLVALLAAMLFAIGGLINAIYAKKFDDISFIPIFILTPLTYLGGVFYSISQLPSFWQKVSYWNPILAFVDIFRYGLLGISDINIYWAFLLIIFLLVSFFCWAWYLIYQGIGLKV